MNKVRDGFDFPYTCTSGIILHVAEIHSIICRKLAGDISIEKVSLSVHSWYKRLEGWSQHGKDLVTSYSPGYVFVNTAAVQDLSKL